ncbi:MAG: hypothetical protein R6W90_10660 [Ignavibacteriaceae bacterium]
MKSSNPEISLSLSRIIFSVLAVNIIGLILRYFEYDTYLIILGFRLHLSFVLPLLILYPDNFFNVIKDAVKYPLFNRKFLPVVWIVLSFGIILAILFLMGRSEISDPEYFYEFGLSSIFDYPVYLIWNFPQFLLLFSYLLISTFKSKIKFLPVFVIIIFLFLYEFVPLDFREYDLKGFDYIPIIELILTGVSAGIFLHFYSNVYWFTFLFFSALWLNLLAFGSKSGTMINILFAAQYSEWEGFFTVNKDLNPYILSSQLILLIVMLLISIPLSSKRVQPSETVKLEEIQA